MRRLWIATIATLKVMLFSAALVHAAPIEAPAPAELGKVYVFLSSECPCSDAHVESLKELATLYAAKGFEFIGVHANQDESEAAGQAYFAKLALPFKVVRDHGAKLANRFGALKTPHAFVVDPKGAIRFSGGMDNSKDPKRASEHYLKDALDAVAVGQQPRVRRARALGCVIKRKG